MLFSSLFQEGRIRKYSARFWALLEQGEVRSALTLYDEYLSSFDTKVNKSLRATYHFYRWLERKDDEDLRAVELLASGEPNGSQVVRAAHVMRRYKRESNLAAALRQRNSDRLTAAFEPADFPESEDLERLALAILETFRSDHSEKSRQLAIKVQRDLTPLAHLSGQSRLVRDVLLLWSNWTLGQYTVIFQDNHLLQSLQTDEYKSFWPAAVYAWGARELVKGQTQRALKVLDEAKKRASAEQVLTMILAWGLRALEQGSTEAAVDWFSHPVMKATTQDAPAGHVARLFALSLAYFQVEQYTLGRSTLDQLIEQQPDEPTRSQAQYLQGLSFLAEAQNWPAPQAADDQETAHEGTVHNRAMWGTLRERFRAIAADLSQRSATSAWRGHLLAALVAYIDSNTTLSMDQLEQFSAAIEQVDSEQGRLRLKAIEGVLVTRAKATEEAIGYTQRKEYAKLRELQDQVLDPLADAIPAPVRAAVYMSLWEGDPSYDLLPDLQRISLTPDDEELINKCILQVQVVATLKRLQEICIRPRRFGREALPSLVPLSFDESVAKLGALAAAAIQLRQGNWREALNALPKIDGTEGQDFLEMLHYVRFYAAWKLNDIETCLSTTQQAGANRFLERHDNWQTALGVRRLLSALEDGQDELAFELLLYIKDLSPTDYLDLLELPPDASQHVVDREIGKRARELHTEISDEFKLKRQELKAKLSSNEITQKEFDSQVSEWEAETKQKQANLLRLSDTLDLRPSNKLIAGIAVWLLEHQKPHAVMTLLNVVRREVLVLTAPVISQSYTDRLNRMLSFLTGLAAAQMGQYTACVDAFDLVLSQSAPEDSRTIRQLRGWAKLFKLQAELALIAQGTEDVNLRWPSVRRSLAEQAEQLTETPILQAYGFLVLGLVSFLTADTLVDEATIVRLAHAQRVLSLSRHARFLMEVISQLQWRQQVIAQFWGSLHHGDLRQSRAIYTQEIEPAFGDRVPHSIQLGMVIVDWDAGTYTTSELIKRLMILEHDAPELDRELIQKVKDYIIEGDKTRHFTELVEKKDFEAVIEFVERSEWAKAGVIPVSVAIALLYAYYRKERLEDAERFAGAISDAPGLADWVRDDGFLIRGYVLFRKEKYDEAAEAFEKIRVSQLLGHNVDKYWAIAHFSHGLQLLKVDQKEKAFDAFRRSLGQRGAAQENVNLAPLFTHFGLKNIEARNGNRALESFKLMGDSLEGATEDSPNVFKNRLLADMGQLLCRSLMEQDAGEIPKGDDFLALVERLDKYKGELPEGERYQLDRACRVMAVSQELRRECMLGPLRKQADLCTFLRKQVEALEKLASHVGKQDPVLLVLAGLIELHLEKRSNLDKGLDLLIKAVRLGVQSPRLAMLIQELDKEKTETLESEKAILDLFDMYLIQSTIPPQLKDGLIRQDDIVELYRLNRNYIPKELAAPNVQSSIAIMEKRLAHIICTWVGAGDLKDNSESSKLVLQLTDQLKKDDGEISELVQQLAEQLKKGKNEISNLIQQLSDSLKQMKNLERKFLNSEQEVMTRLAQKISKQPAGESQ